MGVKLALPLLGINIWWEFGCKVLGSFETNRQEVTGGWGKLH
jgi:hypothetical protein